MRKTIIALVLAGAAVAGVLAAPGAQAQTFPSVSGIRPFTPEANYMSLPGFLRMRYYQQTGQWISREAAVQAVQDQGGFTGPGTGQ